MSSDRWLEIMEDELTQQVNSGRISQVEYHKAMKEIHEEYRDMMREAAQEAYNREMDRW